MKKILINVLLYIIFCELVFAGMLKAVEGLDNTPVGRYHKAIDEGISWTEYIEKNK